MFENVTETQAQLRSGEDSSAEYWLMGEELLLTIWAQPSPHEP